MLDDYARLRVYRLPHVYSAFWWRVLSEIMCCPQQQKHILDTVAHVGGEAEIIKEHVASNQCAMHSQTPIVGAAGKKGVMAAKDFHE